MTRDFIPRHNGVQSLSSCLLKTVGEPLMDQYLLAERAGKALAPVLKPFRLAIDFSDPAYCRIEGQTLVLLTESAVQQNRLRQLTQRLTAALVAEGLPFTAVEVRIIARTPDPEPLVIASSGPRPKSAIGAAAVGAMLTEFENDKLRATMEKLRAALSPDEEDLRTSLENRLCKETMELIEERRKLDTHAADLRYGINASDIPTEEEAQDYPRLEAERERKLALLLRQEDELRITERRLARIDIRLEAIDRALELLPTDPVAAEAAALERVPEPEAKATPSPISTTLKPSASGAAAILSLASQTQNLRLRKTLEQLGRLIDPATNTAIRALAGDINREETRIRENKTALTEEAKARRLEALREARRTLRDDPLSVRAVAARLYGRN